MYYSVAIAGILTAWPVGETNKEDTSTGSRHNSLHTGELVESAHASMRTKKRTDAIHRVPTDTVGAMDWAATDFGTLYEQFKRPLHSYIYRLLGSLEDADDLVQEVFTRAFIAWNGLYDRDNLSPWLYRIATNLCVDHLRRRKRITWWPLIRPRRGRGVDAAGEGREEDMPYLPLDDGGIPEVGEREHIQRTLASMPRDYAIVLVLSAAQGVPYQEIAGIVGISPNAAATRISRAKRMFMEVYQRLSDEGAGKQE